MQSSALKIQTAIRPAPTSATKAVIEPSPQKAYQPRARVQEIQKPKNTFNYLDASKMTLDALLRGIFRFAETFITNPVARIGFRAVSESNRKLVELVGFKALKGEKITNSDWRKAIVRVLENTAGSAVFEPNKYTNRLVRIGVGLANMGVRFATRAGLYAMKAIDEGALGLDHISDEIFGRSILRAIFADTNNPIIGIGARFLEQLGINATVHVQPITNYISKKIIKPNTNESEQNISKAA